jgi:uncharacterized protein (TIGR02266 family)
MPAIALVAPVRFAGGGLSLQTTISRLGPEGVFVRSLVSPREGAKMDLALSLPGAARPLHVKGTVATRPPDVGKDAGFWVTFEEVPDDARAFIDVLLKTRGVAGRTRPRPAPESRAAKRAEEGRAWPRIPARLRVGWTSSRDFLSAWSQNISRGGIFIATDHPPELREVVELSVELPDGKPPVKTRAEVVHCVMPEQARRTGTTAGAGLQFLDADDDFRERLDACIEVFKD